MGIEFKINITKKIKVNGKEYDSLDEVPEAHRQTVQNALNSAETGTPGKFNINGVGYDSPEAMPPEVRKIYENSVNKAKAMALEKGIDLSELGLTPGSSLQFTLGVQPGAPVQESGLSLRTIIILATITALSVLAILFAPK
ncbi:MAG TPA: hypothetical protein DCZ92_15075 [Elusimicrobia bacterium]|nr:MAG: hypothetical protein A2016_03335 [Elusimicrobia bacterium GWF2_62_30]HBA62104.1 hypothetical protein [Elusimicrobiota bacterium]